MPVLTRVAQPARRLLPTGAFARGVGVLVGGTAGAQLLMVLAAPVLTRLYAPDDFGLLAVFTACMALFTVVAAGRYELAIPLPEDDREGACLAVLGVLCVLLTSALSLIAVLAWGSPLAALAGAPGLVPYLWLLPLGVLFVGVYQVFNKWAVRSQRFAHVARTRIGQSLGTLGIQVGASGLGPLGLLGGQAVGQGVGAAGLALAACRHPAFRRVSLAGMRRQAWRHRRFPLYSVWTGLFNTGSLQLAPIVLVALFGTQVAGLYALTLRILTMPVSLVGNAIGSVFLANAAQARRDGRLAALVAGLHRRLAVLGIPPMITLMIVAPEAFALLFGEPWRQAGVYAQWMLPWIYIQFQWSPLSMLASVLELQRDALLAQFGMLVARFGALVGLYLAGAGADAAILAFSVISALVYLLQQGWFFHRAGLSLRRCAARELGQLLTFGALSLLPMLAYRQEVVSLVGFLVLMGAIAGIWIGWRLKAAGGEAAA